MAAIKDHDALNVVVYLPHCSPEKSHEAEHHRSIPAASGTDAGWEAEGCPMQQVVAVDQEKGWIAAVKFESGVLCHI
jgi:hypothetical protein